MSKPAKGAKEKEADKPAPNAAHRAPAVARAATVLRLLASERAGLGVTEIARRVGLVPSTCLHVLRALVDEGFILFDNKEKTYRTGTGLLTLVRDALATSAFPRIVQPILDDLAATFHITAIAMEQDGRDRMVVVALSRADAIVSLNVDIGSRFPSLISATGRCVAAAAGWSREELQERFAELRWERAPRFEDWYAEVERARVEGFAVDRSNVICGVTVIAGLLPEGADRRPRGIALIGFEHRLTERIMRDLKKALLKSVASIAAQVH